MWHITLQQLKSLGTTLENAKNVASVLRFFLLRGKVLSLHIARLKASRDQSLWALENVTVQRDGVCILGMVTIALVLQFKQSVLRGLLTSGRNLGPNRAERRATTDVAPF